MGLNRDNPQRVLEAVARERKRCGVAFQRGVRPCSRRILRVPPTSVLVVPWVQESSSTIEAPHGQF